MKKFRVAKVFFSRAEVQEGGGALERRDRLSL